MCPGKLSFGIASPELIVLPAIFIAATPVGEELMVDLDLEVHV